MRTLLLFRHAKADKDPSHATDHERPLTGKGKDAAAMMGRYLKGIDQVPDLVVSSSAVRARDTAQRAAKAGEWKCPIVLEDALYATSPKEVLSFIKDLDDEARVVMLVGHEPTWSELAGRLIGGAALDVPTAALARIDLDIETWSRADFGCGVLVWLVTPRSLEPLAER
jgi:phosphohistidine phosphatase